MKENRRWSMDRLDACIRSPVEKSICFFFFHLQSMCECEKFERERNTKNMAVFTYTRIIEDLHMQATQ